MMCLVVATITSSGYDGISDDGSMVAFAGVHNEFKRGIYVANPETGQWRDH